MNNSAQNNDLEKLLVQISAGDREAFSQLYEKTHAKLFGVISRIIFKRDLAEDILQETYLRIWRKAGQYRGEFGAAMSWLSVIARNAALDARRRGAEKISEHSAPPLEDMISEDKDALSLAEQSDTLKQLNDCLNELAQERREMVLLAYYRGWSREELSTQYNKPVSSIKTLLRRSLINLKGCLDGHNK